jgi:hypothetical protein
LEICTALINSRLDMARYVDVFLMPEAYLCHLLLGLRTRDLACTEFGPHDIGLLLAAADQLIECQLRLVDLRIVGLHVAQHGLDKASLVALLLLQCRPIAAGGAERAAGRGTDRCGFYIAADQTTEERATNGTDDRSLHDVLPEKIARRIKCDALWTAGVRQVIADAARLSAAALHHQTTERNAGDGEAQVSSP